MDVFIVETRDHQRIEISHAAVSSSTNELVCVGDHVLRIQSASGISQVIMTDEQWGRLVDCFAMTIARKH